MGEKQPPGAGEWMWNWACLEGSEGARESVPNSDVRRAAEGRDCRGDPGPSGAQRGSSRENNTAG